MYVRGSSRPPVPRNPLLPPAESLYARSATTSFLPPSSDPPGTTPPSSPGGRASQPRRQPFGLPPLPPSYSPAVYPHPSPPLGSRHQLSSAALTPSPSSVASSSLQFYSVGLLQHHQPSSPPCSPPSGHIGPVEPRASAFNSSLSSASLQTPPSSSSCDFQDDPPLLGELGINPDHILKRMRSVLFFYKLDHYLLVDSDMCGPLVVVLILGFSLLLSGKPTFGYIYGLGVLGCVATYVLLNLMGQQEGIDLYRTMSILGYGLLPVDALALLSLVMQLRTLAGMLTSVVCILWCTATASRFFETALQLHQQRYLLAYPIGLLYACFVLIIVF
eukprot:GHVS01008382.1.p1 GENE.GHVS01008382.1~~GHVS01008382.1.p1  ORF type:complete len:371 (-),score=60.28 GHVS01008382.1:49-1041(-)